MLSIHKIELNLKVYVIEEWDKHRWVFKNNQLFNKGKIYRITSNEWPENSNSKIVIAKYIKNNTGMLFLFEELTELEQLLFNERRNKIK